MPSLPHHESLELDEQIAKVKQLVADTDAMRQEIRLAPWQLVISGMTAGAAFFAAGAAFTKFLS